MRTFTLRSFGVILLAIVSIMLLTPNAQATLLLQDNFNTENGGVGILNYTGFANWNVAPTTYVDLIGNGYFDFYPGQGLYVDLDGTGTSQGKMISNDSWNLIAGRTYTIDFWLGGSQRDDGLNSVTVSLGSWSNTYTLDDTDPLTNYVENLTFLSTEIGANLIFDASGYTSDWRGLILDDVTLSVPEPSTLLIFGAGLVGIGLMRRRFTK
jgi:hypothetical protein